MKKIDRISATWGLHGSQHTIIKKRRFRFRPGGTSSKFGWDQVWFYNELASLNFMMKTSTLTLLELDKNMWQNIGWDKSQPSPRFSPGLQIGMGATIDLYTQRTWRCGDEILLYLGNEAHKSRGAKGQLISKCLFGVIVWTKKPTIFF